MAFNSFTFASFCLIVFPLYYLSPFRLQNILLLFASYLFYGAWDPRFLSLILISTCIDYFIGSTIAKTENPKIRYRLLLVSCFCNLGMLGFFKYFNFFLEGAQDLLSLLTNQPAETFRLNIILPIGISFYTFQTMSYTIDIYRGNMQPSKRFLDFALFVAFFPQLVAGPIERASNFLPQISKPRKITSTRIREGLWLLILGYFKKVVIADNMAIIVNQVFESEETPGGMACLIAVYAFAYQIYGDFSGYSDIARGLAKLMGIDLMKNFNIPLLATNPADHWQRWHISFSTWLRDYVYFPLGGSRGTRARTYRNLLITLLVSGIWHGAGYRFLLWGIYQGILLVLYRYICRERKLFKSEALYMKIIWLVVWFHFASLGRLLFRSRDLNQVCDFIGAILTDMRLTVDLAEPLAYLLFFPSMLWAVEFSMRNVDDPHTSPAWKYGLGYIIISMMLLAILLFPAPVNQTFIYFQF